MAVTKAQQAPQQRVTSDKPTTTLDSDITKPQITAPGDAPADTLDPTERASSAEPDKATAAAAGFGTVNAVVRLPEPDKIEEDTAEDRVEDYDVIGPDGKKKHVTHNIDTGESSVG